MARYLRNSEQTLDGQPAAVPCSCTGGPYIHGPEGLRLALQEIAAKRELEQGEDTDDD